jgi:hypothetical protein
MSTPSHPNSLKVTIFRANNFVQNAQKDEAVADFMSQSSKSISPYWQSNTARVIGSGLSIPEQELLMPYLIQIEKDDREFRTAVFKFFNSLSTKIPFSTGKDFEIGLEKSNTEELSKNNMPIDIEQYVRYRHAKNHPWVAGSKSEAEGNQLKLFYIHDADKQHKEDTDKLVIQDEADEIWLKIKNQPQKVTMLLTSLGFDERDYLGRNGETRKQNDLREFINKDGGADKFLKVYRDERFETKYWLKAMVKAAVVEEVGISFVIRETKKLLGRSEMETVLFLENPDNADTVSYLKGATQDALKKPRTLRSNNKKPV